MKKQKYSSTMKVLAGAALVLACSGPLHAQTANLVLDNFSSGSQWAQWYGYDTFVYAPGVDDGISGDTGSEYITDNISLGGNVMTLGDVLGGNLYYFGGGSVDFSKYQAIQFDILWDTTSGLTIDQFNTGTNWQSSLFNSPEPQNWVASQGYINGIDLLIESSTNPNNDPDLGSQNIPKNAAFGWQTMSYPIPLADSGGITASEGVVFKKWASPNATNIASTATGAYWIDNLVLIGNTNPIPNPTLAAPVKPIPGLNIFNATEGNSFYDRNEVVADTTSGLSWIGNPGATYSFNMTGFPTAGTNDLYGSEAYMFLVPNAAAEDNAPDYNEPACMVLEVQSTPTGAQTYLSYKVNSPNGEPATPVITNQSTKLFGTYSLTFTGDETGYLTGPDGGTTNFTLNGSDGTNFAETGSAAYNFLFYIGGQANNSYGMSQAVVYNSASITGVSSPVSETFAGETALVNFTNAPTHDLSSVVLVPNNAAYWIDWSLPASGFALENTASLTSPHWNSTFANGLVGLYGTNAQLVLTSDLQTPSTDNYFQLIKRTYSSLLVALPGQTFTSGVGVTGTPSDLPLGGGNGPLWLDTAVAYAVDSGNNLVNTVTAHQILLDCTTDSAASDDFEAGTAENNYETVTMTSGVASFTGSDGFGWGYDGLTAPATETVTVEDQDTSFTAVSSPVTLH
jgi:hypothetical protein